jgi:hypothetical protein
MLVILSGLRGLPAFWIGIVKLGYIDEKIYLFSNSHIRSITSDEVSKNDKDTLINLLITL